MSSYRDRAEKIAAYLDIVKEAIDHRTPPRLGGVDDTLLLILAELLDTPECDSAALAEALDKRFPPIRGRRARK